MRERKPEHVRVRPNSSQNYTENDLFSSENEDEDEDFCKQTADSKCKEYLEKCNAMNNATVNEIEAEDISTENVTNVSSEIDEEEIESNFGNSTGLNFRDENSYGTSGITLGKKYALNITWHSALKLEKKCNFKSAKTHFLLFQKWQKINFCTRKKFKTTKNPVFFSPKIAFLVVLNFFLVQKLIFCHF